ncbi:MAG: hypothetical protein ACF8QF_10225 [Phycisphaerales bacterium]
MAGGREYSKHQKGIINRYYEHRDTIASGKLAELVSELYLATTDAQRKRLWTRVEQALRTAQAEPARMARVLESQDVQLLAALVADIDAGRGVRREQKPHGR